MSKSPIQKFLSSYVDFAERNPFKVILTALVLAGACLWPISKLRIDPNLEALLPENTPTLNAMRESNQRFGSSDRFTIAIQMEDPVEIARVQDEIKAGLEKWEDVIYVQAERDNTFFVKHALLYLPTRHLEKISDNLYELQQEIGRANLPMVEDLLGAVEAKDHPGEKKKERTWFDASIVQELGLPDEAADTFSDFLGPKKESPEKAEPVVASGIPDSLSNRFIGRHPDGTLNGVVQAALKYPSSNTQYVSSVISRTEAILAPIRARYGNKINVGIEGPYKELEEVESLQLNGLIATGISLVLIVFIILGFFRSFGALVAIVLQVALSCIYTMGFTGLYYGRLNLYTMFVFAILLGMGIDYSIHLMGHAQKATQKGQTWPDALKHTMAVLFQPMFLAALTTVAGMLTLLSAEFVGFYEFGVIASVGIGFSLLSACLVLPAFIFLFDRGKNVPVLKWFALPTRPMKSLWPRALAISNVPRFIQRCAVTVLALTVLLAFWIPKADFEYDFRNLRDTRQKPDSGRHVGVALSSNRKSSQPIVAMADDAKTMEVFHDTLLHRLTVDKDPMLRSFLTLTTFAPPLGRQEERMEVIEDIRGLISARVFDRAEGNDKKMIEKLRDMVDVEPFTPEDIPAWALRLVQEQDGTYGKIAFIYASYNASDARESAELQDRYGRFHLNNENLKLYSSSFIYADIIRLVHSDSNKMTWLISLIIILTLALSLRSWKLLFISIVGLGCGGVVTIGLMGLLDIKLGPFNLIVIPTILGVSIDSIIHLSIAYRRYGPSRLDELYKDTGSLVAASVITTLAGYAGMMFTTHQGIETIGSLAILGFSSCLVTAILLSPWLCVKLKVKAEGQESGGVGNSESRRV